MQNVYFIKWGRQLTENYGYGSLISFQPGQTEFANPMLSPGEVIHLWKSHTDEEHAQTLVSLPTLIPGVSYHLDAIMTVTPAESVQLVVEFYDQADGLVEKFDYFTDGTFTVPPEASSYQIKLININNQQLQFQRLVLGETALWERFDFPELTGGGQLLKWQPPMSTPLKTVVTLLDRTPETIGVPLEDGQTNWVVLVDPHNPYKVALQLVAQLKQTPKTDFDLGIITIRQFGRATPILTELQKEIERQLKS